MERKELENSYIKKMTELQIWWGNPVDDDWRFVSGWSDEQLQKSLSDTVGQLRFEKFFYYLKRGIVFAISIFIVLGVVGLLLFGVRQLF